MGRGVLSQRAALTLFGVTALATVLFDRATKALVRESMLPSQSVAVLGEWLQLTRVENAGAAFGLLQGRQVFLALVGAAVIVAVGVYLWRARPREPWVLLSLGLVAGGSIGNLVDRVTTGVVVDFVEVPLWPVFNVADSAVVVGTAILVLHVLFYRPSPAPEEPSS
jgi:signal peptidase II